MPFKQFGSSSSATFGNYNDISGTANTISSVTHVHNNFNQDSSAHGALVRELRERLNPFNLTGENRSRCLENTRKHTLQSIDEWVGAEGYPNILFLVGAAGTGKSTIATTVAMKYQEIGQLGCYMFFLRGKSHPANVLQTIAYSLAMYRQNIAESLLEKLRDSGDIVSSDLKAKFKILLCDSLSTITANVGPPILIVLDALDECGTSETRHSLIDVLYRGLPTLPSNYRFLVTTRPEVDILPFISLPHLKVHTLNLDYKAEENRLSVSTYIKYELEKLKSSNAFVIPQDWDWEGGIQSLANTADGLFIWASTAIKFISEKKLGRFRHLKNLIENRNTLNLNGLYTAILKDAFEWDEEVKEAFVGVFSFILFCKTPLSVEVINGILGTDTASDVLTCLRSLVVFEPDYPISIRHASFYDYLVSCKEHSWYIDAEVQKSYIATKCLERMGELLKYNICDLQSGYVLNCDVPDLDDRVAQYIPPSLKYICCNWAYHLRDVSYSQELCSQLRSFVYNQLLFWFEALSLTNTFNNNVGPALQFAIDWIGNNDPELSYFLRDAYRQASIYSEPISMSALQVYNSLLPLTKEDSPMSKRYAKYVPTGYRVEYIGRKRRNDCIKTIEVDRERERGIQSWRQEWEQGLFFFLLFSPDGTRILSDPVRVVCVWEATSGKLITGPLTGDDESLALTATYSPDGRYIIVASDDGILRKWDALTNCPVWEREIDRKQVDLSRVMSAVFAPDAKSIVFGDCEGKIVVFSVDTGEQGGEPLEGHTNSVRCLSFSSDGQYFASGSDDMTINIWAVDRRKVKISPFKKHTEAVTAVNFSPSGNNVISGSKDRTILVWDTFTGEVLREIECKGEVNSVTYSPNGLYILAGGWQWIRMWKVDDVKAPPKVFQVGFGSIRGVAFSPDSSRFVSLNDRRAEIRIWDASWGVEETKTTFEEQGQIRSISLSPSGEFIASGLWCDSSIYLWNVLSGGLVKKLKLRCRVNSVSFSPVNEKLIAFGTEDGTVEVWDVTNEEPVTIGNHERLVSSVAFSLPDGNHVASGSRDETICIWNVKSRELALGPLKGHKGKVLAVAYSPDGTRLVSGSYDKTVRIWNSETGQLLSTLNGHSDLVHSLAYSFDGSRIVSGSYDNTILVWNAESGEIIGEPITRHDSWMNSVCFLPDGKRILSGSRDKTARVWDALTGEHLFPPFSGHTNPINSVCFFPDGTRFATGSADGTIRVWTLDEIPNEINWELKRDGWVVGENGELMMWIPYDLRDRVCGHRNISMLNRSFYVKLDFGTERNTSRNIQV